MVRIRSLLTLSALLLPCLAFAGQEMTHGYFIASDNIKIHYVTKGQGVPVVLIHGYTGSAEGNWFSNGIADAIAETNYVVAIDVRGHGRSDKPRNGAMYGDRLWRDVLELMDHLNIQKAHVHGYSMGGGIITQLLINAPERFISAAYGGSGVRETDPEWQSTVPADKKGIDPQEQEARSTLTASPFRDQAALDAVREGFGQRSRVDIDLASIEIPVLAINGELDSPNAKTHRMQRELKNFQNLVLPGKSHLTAIMAGYIPQIYITTLVDFIRANNPT